MIENPGQLLRMSPLAAQLWVRMGQSTAFRATIWMELAIKPTATTTNLNGRQTTTTRISHVESRSSSGAREQNISRYVCIGFERPCSGPLWRRFP